MAGSSLNGRNFGVYSGNATSATFSDFLTNGSTIYVVLYWEVSNKWSSAQYTYTSASSTSAPAPPPTGCGHSYSTSFPDAENPLSQNGEWIDGGTVGVEWGNVQNTSGAMFGTIINGAPPYNDSTAILAGGPWCQNQTAQATVFINATDSSSQEEVELHLNTTITSNSITGYEGDVSVLSGNLYFVWARWNGPLNSYCYIHSGTCDSSASIAQVQVHNGDVLKATNVNGLLTLYDNGTAIITAKDTTYTGGTPGVGFWNVGGTTADLAHYGFSSFSANDGGSMTPVPDVVLNWTTPPSGTIILDKAQVSSASECGTVNSWTQIPLATGTASYTDNSVVAGAYYCYGLIWDDGGAYSALSNIIEAEVTAGGGTIVDLSAPVPIGGVSNFNGSVGTQ
jgi:hypothetical protein